MASDQEMRKGDLVEWDRINGETARGVFICWVLGGAMRVTVTDMGYTATVTAKFASTVRKVG